MKLQIGICDDKKVDMERTKRVLEKVLSPLPCDYEITEYLTGNALVKDEENIDRMDVVFLDIDMPGMDGIEVANHITKMNPFVNIIFVTNHEDLVFQAIHCSPFRFVRKTKMEEEVEEAITSVLTKIKDELVMYDFSDNVKIAVRDVNYIESQGHYLHINLKDGKVVTVRGKISDYEERLSGIGFIRIHIGYLVNVRCVYSISSKGVILDNQEMLPISRKNTEKIKELQANHMRRFVRGIH